jgi:2'-5' RNA ligase
VADRLFIGVPVQGINAADLTAWQLGSGLPGAPVVSENLHVTLRFLGDVDPLARDLLIAELEEADLGPPFTTIAQGLGAFPRASQAAVVWLDLAEGVDDLTALFHAVDHACDDAGLDLEDRPFRPHLTVSRLRPAGDVRDFIEQVATPRLKIPVAEVVLFRSHLGRGGARYERLEAFSLD